MGAKKETEDAALATARTFKSVNGKDLTAKLEGQGNLRFIRPKELADAGTTGVVAEGIYEGSQPNSFDTTKSDYKIRLDNGDLVIINSSGSLAAQMAKVAVGAFVQVTYLGMKVLTQGKMKGKNSHSFVVGIAE